MRADAFHSLVRFEANERHETHKDHASSRPLSLDYKFIGLMGEVEFAKATGFMLDLERKPGGDSGFDFVVPLDFKIDVKTAEKAFNLIHEAGKPFRADIYVLAKYDPLAKTTTLIGWEFGTVLKAAPTKDFGHGIINHYIPASKLRSMESLFNKIRR